MDGYNNRSNSISSTQNISLEKAIAICSNNDFEILDYQKLLLELSLKVESLPPAVGLINLGNRCFFNSAIQCLSQSPILVPYFLNLYRITDQQYMKNSLLLSKKSNCLSLLEAWMSLLYELHTSTDRYISPKGFDYYFKQLDTATYARYSEEDSFMTVLDILNALDGAVTKPVQVGFNNFRKHNLFCVDYATDADDLKESIELLKYHYNCHDSVVTKLFDGVESYVYTCLQCNHYSQRKYVHFRYLHLVFQASSQTNIGIIFPQLQQTLKQFKMSSYAPLNVLRSEIIDFLKEQGKMNIKDIDHIKLIVFCEKTQSFTLVNNHINQTISMLAQNYKLFYAYVINSNEKQENLSDNANGSCWCFSIYGENKSDNIFRIHDNPSPLFYIQLPWKKDSVIISRDFSDYVSSNVDNTNGQKLFVLYNNQYITRLNEITIASNMIITIILCKHNNFIQWERVSRGSISLLMMKSYELIIRKYNLDKLNYTNTRNLNNIDECLKEYQNKIYLNESSNFRCLYCRNVSAMVCRYIKILSCPTLLIIKIDRHNQSSKTQIDKYNELIRYSINLKIYGYNETLFNYNLYGVICHHSYTNAYGHYTCYIKSLKNSRWYLMNDSSWTLVEDENDVIHHQASILFYKQE